MDNLVDLEKFANIGEADKLITLLEAKNIEFFVGDYMEDFAEIIKDTDFIMIDIDHMANTERLIMQRLRDLGYKGLVMLDDIGLNDEMKSFWAEIPEKKIDISKYAHWSLSGLVIFDPTRFKIVLE